MNEGGNPKFLFLFKFLTNLYCQQHFENLKSGFPRKVAMSVNYGDNYCDPAQKLNKFNLELLKVILI